MSMQLGNTINLIHHYIKFGKLDDKSMSEPQWDDLIDDLSDDEVPLVDRKQVDEASLTPDQEFYRDNGYLIMEKFMPDDLIEAYCKVRSSESLGGYSSSTPYMFVDEIKELGLYKPLMDKLEELIGEPMGMHLNLTGWISTERNWHQDEYLNPPDVNGWYISVWMALDDIHPDAGPFEFVPGSHKWQLVRRNKVLEFLKPIERIKNTWPKASERFLTRLFGEQVKKNNLKAKKFIAKKGDVLLWHSRLMHRGTSPKDTSLLRKAFISHYSGIHHRKDMPIKRNFKSQGHYFVLSNSSLGRTLRNIIYMFRR